MSLGNGSVKSFGTIPLDTHHLQARALALLRKSGPLKKADPNAVRSRPSEQRREQVMKRVARETDENSPGVPTTDTAGEGEDIGVCQEIGEVRGFGTACISGQYCFIRLLIAHWLSRFI